MKKTVQLSAESDPWNAAARYEGIFSQAAVGIAMVSLEGRWLEANQRLCAITGYTENELLATTFQAITHPDDLEADLDHVRQLLADVVHDYTMEKRYLRKDGSYTWVDLTVSLVRDKDGQPLHFAVIVQPIDVRKALERKARESQERLEGFFRQAAVGMIVLDAKSCFLRVNEHFCELLDYKRDELRTIPYMALNHPEDLPRDKANFQRLLAGEISEYIMEKRLLHREGHYIWTLISVAVVHNDAAAPYVVAIVQDIGPRKQLEAEVQASKYELELRVEERTRELRLAWQQTEEALRAAETASRMKSEFLATMSHEIRTPLNGVIGFNGLLLDSPLNNEQLRYAELARQSGENLLHLLNDFLDYSKIEEGYLELEPINFDPHMEIDQVLSLIEDNARQKGLDLRHNINAPHHLRGDAGRLRQVLLNLLSNAVKFTEQGHVLLCCEEMMRQGRIVWLCLQVIDTGIGIDPSVRDKVFQPFTQADASTTRRFGGTGLGLAICKRLVDAMGGKIGVHSQPDQGSKFWAQLPFELSPVDGKYEVVQAPEVPLSADVRHARILVVEDNPVSQLLAATMLERLGCRVDVVGNGAEAVEVVRRLPYDLIFMDCDMPVLNGFDATRAIRKWEPEGRHVPIIALTASALAGDCERCLAVGMDDFLAKPVRHQDLAQKVMMWLRSDE